MARPNAFDTNGHLCGPSVFSVSIMLLVEALGEAQHERGPLIGGKGESIDGDGFGGTHASSLA
jgi:hypothetical protein